MYHVYILRCADNSFYVGSTHDLEGREQAHNNGRGAKHTFRRRPVKLIYSEPFPTLEAATKRELQLKRWSRAKKEALTAGNVERLKALSTRRTQA